MKKSFKAFALTLFVILSVAMIAVGTSAASIPGDVNGDGEVNIRDAAHLLLFITDHDVELACTHSGYVVINPAVDPTYDQPGLTIGVSCTKCGEKLIPQDTIPALGHEHTEAVIPAVAANCQQEGLTEGKYCTTCNMVLVEQQTTPKTACNYVSTIVSPTCEEQGYTGGVCISSDQIAYLPYAVKLAKRTVKIQKFNFALGIIVKVVLVALAFLGMAKLWWAVLADAIVSVVCALASFINSKEMY